MNSISNIAVLITCYNRKQKTLNSLSALFKNNIQNYHLSVFLVDDGSTDGTSTAIKNKFPEVTVIQGNGNLFWNQGMRLAWKTAAKKLDFDYYLWLNDDTVLNKKAIKELLKCNKEAIKKDDKSAIIVGSCQVSKDIQEFSYGGRNDKGPIIPNNKLQVCKYVNGNVVLIPKIVYSKLGNLSQEYTHAMGDFDYGLRAINAGFKCYITYEYIATCDLNKIPQWCDNTIPLKKRWQLLHSPKGLNIKEYNLFRKKFWGLKWILFALKAYLKTLFPKFYSTIKQ